MDVDLGQMAVLHYAKPESGTVQASGSFIDVVHIDMHCLTISIKQKY